MPLKDREREREYQAKYRAAHLEERRAAARAAVHSKPPYVQVVEAALGHPLPRGAVVHHVDEDDQNHSPSNLVACQDHAYHRLIHRRLRALQQCGDPNKRWFWYCKHWDEAVNLRIARHKCIHPDCERRDGRERSRVRRAAA